MILLTGGTGFLGQQLLGRLLVSYSSEEFALLVRPNSDLSAEGRVQSSLRSLFPSAIVRPYQERIVTLAGDVTKENLGLSSDVYDWLALNLKKVFHCAASVSFSQPLDEARESNVGGAQQIIELARRAKVLGNDKVEVHYISTAYVAGDTECIVLPDTLRLDVPFKNSYEQSKAEAEYLIRSAGDDVHSMIYRPSIIVGDSVTGETSSFNVIYGPARFLVRGLLKAVPGRPGTPFDVVPVDYVADSIATLSGLQRPSKTCYHICTGYGRETTVLEILEQLILAFQNYSSKKYALPPFVPPEVLALLQQSLNVALLGVKNLEKFLGSHFEIIDRLVPYFPYMARNPRFDTSLTCRELSGVLPPAPLFTQYADQLFAYCVYTNWGKLPWHNPTNLANWFHRRDDIKAICNAKTVLSNG